jgi:hypothetical protein
MILARRRSDLKQDEMLIPFRLISGQIVQCEADMWHVAEQPDELDDKEYNLVIYNNSTREVVAHGIAIDCDYKDIPIFPVTKKLLPAEQEEIAQRLSQSMTLPALYEFRASWATAYDDPRQEHEIPIIDRAIELS